MWGTTALAMAPNHIETNQNGLHCKAQFSDGQTHALTYVLLQPLFPCRMCTVGSRSCNFALWTITVAVAKMMVTRGRRA